MADLKTLIFTPLAICKVTKRSVRPSIVPHDSAGGQYRITTLKRIGEFFGLLSAFLLWPDHEKVKNEDNDDKREKLLE